MALYQNAVLNKYLSEQNKVILESQYALYKSYFLNITIQHNIIKSKEEEFQEGFLRELFVKILGYTINPEPDFNLRTELKNEKDSKKADGAIINEDKVLAVIELKSTTTIDLNKIEIQAFNYKNNQQDCRYVITSNFQKLRFYIDNAIEYLEWDLFKLDFQNFKILYLCLSRPNIFNDIPGQIKKESLTEEENVTKKLYKEYSNFRKSLFNSIVELNPTIDKLLLFKKTQKLLDRFLFLLFAEDRMLVPPNSVRVILEQWTKLKEEMDAYQPLYDRFKLYFSYLNTGHTGKLHDIFAYNGGLFAEDEILDILKVDDAILYDATLGLSRYDYNSEVDVNILGHIFEHSLTEIEELEREITNSDSPTSKTTKRKKDGVFYTPKYITKYIIDNTVGALCKNKKQELGLSEEEYVRGRRNIKTQKPLLDKLNQYKEWLLSITILDPACGSGAFLSQALESLIYEHNNIAYLESILTKKIGDAENVQLIEYGIESHILENNLFGVDINEESIEIAKLSLWLRTARKGRKLSSLNSNIKCGNSLVSDKIVAGEKAFNWAHEFPQIFECGGFDVVIGNPPYVSHDRIEYKEFLSKNYKCYSSFTDLYSFFYELGVNILKESGHLYFITSNSFLKAEYGRNLRKVIIDNTTIKDVNNIDETQIFGGAIVNTVLVHLIKNKIGLPETANIVNNIFDELKEDFYSFISKNTFVCNQDYFTYGSWSLAKPENEVLKRKIANSWKTLENLNTQIRLGIATGDNDVFIIDESKRKELINEDSKNRDLIKPILRGRDIERYSFKFQNLYILLTRNEINVELEYPTVFKYFDSFGDKFKNRGAKGKHWTNLRACSFFDDFSKEKIVWIELTDKPKFTLITEEIYLLNSAYFLLPPEGIQPKYLLALLNSKVLSFYLKMIANTSGMGTSRWINIYVKEFPIPMLSQAEQEPFISKVEFILNRNQEVVELKNNFINYISGRFGISNNSTKLENWYSLTFKELIKEIKTQKVNIDSQEEYNLSSLFEKQKLLLQELLDSLESTNNALDNMVYQLYALNENDKKIIENQ